MLAQRSNKFLDTLNIYDYYIQFDFQIAFNQKKIGKFGKIIVGPNQRFPAPLHCKQKQIQSSLGQDNRIEFKLK